jgi:uncharacterized membrane protein
LSRLEKDQSGIELMNSVKGDFANLSEELTDDAVSISTKYYRRWNEQPAVRRRPRNP